MPPESVLFRVLGPLDVVVAGVPRGLGGPRHSALLAALLVNAGEVVSSERLIAALWGDEPPATAGSLLHVRVSELRRVLRAVGRDEAVLTRRSGYVLQVDPDEIDAQRFVRLAAAGHRALAEFDYERASAQLREALGLWRGPALLDVADRMFAQAEIARLEELRYQALEDCTEADLALGRHGEVVAALTQIVAEQPLRERLWCQLMLALYREGRQGEALQAFQAARAVLVERLGVDPGAELRDLQAAILRHDPRLDLGETIADDRRHRPVPDLPVPLTSFVGRERELAAVRALLRTSRLVSLLGVGGVGKSRLAVEVARLAAADHRDGACLVELTTLSQPGLVVHAIATAVGVRESPQRPMIGLLIDRLRTAEMVLVLDNCEHLVDEVAELAGTLTEACPQVRVLATSRERLGVIGEVLWPLSGLTVPVPDANDAAAVKLADAALLLIERVIAVSPGFRLTDTTASAVAQICQRLDGLPLAIELAAARANAIDVGEIAARLDDRFRLLADGGRSAPARHRTLRSVVDWSYEALTDRQRRLFDRLCVFSGGFTLEAVEVACADPDAPEESVAALVADLVDRSLVVADTTPTSGTRYRMLETLRAYGLDRLDRSTANRDARQRHAAYFLELAERAGAELRGKRQSEWLARLHTEHGNIRVSLEWSLQQGDADAALRMAGALYQFWDSRGHYTEGRGWLGRALAAGRPVRSAAGVRALLACGGLATMQGDLQEAATLGGEAADLCQRAGDAGGSAHALQFLGFVAIWAGELDRATDLLVRAVQSARTANHRWLQGRSLLILAIAALGRADHDQAVQATTESAAILRSVGDTDSVAGALIVQATVAWRQHDLDHAATLLREGLHAYHGLGDRWGLSLGLALAAYLAGAGGDHERQAVILGASEAVRESAGLALLPFVTQWHAAAITEATTALGAEGFRAAWKLGQAMSRDRAVAEALGASGWDAG